MTVQRTNINYLQHIDFKEYEQVFIAIEAGELGIEAISNILTTETGDEWNNLKGGFSVANAKFVYLGENKKLFPTISRFQKVFVVEIDSAYSSEVSGKLYFQMYRQ